MRSWWRIAARRRVVSGSGVASLLLAVAAMSGSWAHGQVEVPRYRSPVEAPMPQPLTPLPAPAAVSPGATVVEYPIARVNDQIIDNSDYQREREELVQQAQQKKLSAADLEQLEKDQLRDMIDWQLLLSRGKELEINADAEVIRQLDEIRKEHNLDSMDALDKAVRDSGMSVEDFKQKIKEDVITQEVIRNEVARNLRLTAKEEQAYYEAHKQDFQSPEQVRLSEILIPTPNNATQAQIDQAQAKANDVLAKLKAGAKFEDLAKQYSGGPNADAGGDLGEFKRGQMAKVLEDQTFSLQPGESTAPIRTVQGFVVLKVAEHQAAAIQPLSAVEEQVQQAVFEAAIEPARRVYLTDLREKAYIEIAPGFVDTGASAKQTKPVFSGATPPPAKKVTQKERMNALRAASTTAPAPAVRSEKAAAPPSATSAATPQTDSAASAKTVAMVTGKKQKKIKREKIRYGQMPRNALPASPEEALTSVADQGPGAPDNGAATPVGAMMMPADQSTNLAANAEPAEPPVPERKKTRYSDRAPTEAQTKAKAKAVKAKEKVIATPAGPTAEEKVVEQAQSAPLGLNGDTATKTKPKKVKGAPKERIQEAPPTPPAPKPDMTPIPPKSVRDNGEPAAAPPPSNLPPVAAPADSGSGATASPTPAPSK
jgi:peptidyl-prolyl cis-trans isomerase SurA